MGCSSEETRFANKERTSTVSDRCDVFPSWVPRFWAALHAESNPGTLATRHSRHQPTVSHISGRSHALLCIMLESGAIFTHSPLRTPAGRCSRSRTARRGPSGRGAVMPPRTASSMAWRTPTCASTATRMGARVVQCLRRHFAVRWAATWWSHNCNAYMLCENVWQAVCQTAALA